MSPSAHINLIIRARPGFRLARHMVVLWLRWRLHRGLSVEREADRAAACLVRLFIRVRPAS